MLLPSKNPVYPGWILKKHFIKGSLDFRTLCFIFYIYNTYHTHTQTEMSTSGVVGFTLTRWGTGHQTADPMTGGPPGPLCFLNHSHWCRYTEGRRTDELYCGFILYALIKMCPSIQNQGFYLNRK